MSSNTLLAYLDCSRGVSAEMLVAALLDAGLPLDILQRTLAVLTPGVGISVEQVTIAGRQGTRLILETQKVATSPQWTLPALSTRLAVASLSLKMREEVIAVFRCLASVQAQFSMTTAGELLFDDTLLALCVCAVLGLEKLHIAEFYVSSLPLLSEAYMYKKDASRNALSLELLYNAPLPVKPSSLDHVDVTPLGAALLVTLARFGEPTCFLQQAGYGVERVDSQTYRGVVLYVGEGMQEQDAHEDIEKDEVSVLSSNIDNMDGELLGGLMTRLFELGALDVSYTSIQMKKNRPATMLTVLCRVEQQRLFARTILRETTTLGVRMERVQRYIANREQHAIETPFGMALVKVKRISGRVVSVRPEFEECQRIASEQGIPLIDVYRVLTSVAQQRFLSPIIESER